MTDILIGKNTSGGLEITNEIGDAVEQTKYIALNTRFYLKYPFLNNSLRRYVKSSGDIRLIEAKVRKIFLKDGAKDIDINLVEGRVKVEW